MPPKNGRGKLPLLCGNMERVITIYVPQWTTPPSKEPHLLQKKYQCNQISTLWTLKWWESEPNNDNKIKILGSCKWFLKFSRDCPVSGCSWINGQHLPQKNLTFYSKNINISATNGSMMPILSLDDVWCSFGLRNSGLRKIKYSES